VTEEEKAYFKMRDVICTALAEHEFADPSYEDLADHVIKGLKEAGYKIVSGP